MATKAELEAENARLRAQAENSAPSAQSDPSVLADGEYLDVADRSGKFTDATGVTHTYDEGSTIVYDADDNPVRTVPGDDADNADDADTSE